jgi:hypothetical protein
VRVPGRITIFGEAYGALRPRATFSVPTAQAIYCGAAASRWSGAARYDRTKDEVGQILLASGYLERMRTDIAGDLPLQYGLASSTAVAIAHLSDRPCEVWPEAVAIVDKQVHGFEPSGADFAAVSRAESGCYGLGRWTSIPFRIPPGSHLLLPEQEGKYTKQEAALRMRADGETLGPLIDSMGGALAAGKGLLTEQLFDYAERLLRIGVYSECQRSIIEPLLARDIVAKGVGSMYDRAILVLAGSEIWDSQPPFEIIAQDEPSAPFQDAVKANGG